jgi:hypothetical protein
MRNACNILDENLKGRGHFEDIRVEGKVILFALNWILEKYGKGVDWIQLAQTGVGRRDSGNTEINLWIQYKQKNF